MDNVSSGERGSKENWNFFKLRFKVRLPVYRRRPRKVEQRLVPPDRLNIWV